MENGKQEWRVRTFLGVVLGFIRYHDALPCLVFIPTHRITLDATCLKEIADFIERIGLIEGFTKCKS
jgi:hypothetical protein